MSLKTTAIIFFSIFIVFAIAITLLNDESSKQTVRIMFEWVAGIVAFYFVVSSIRNKRGSK